MTQKEFDDQLNAVQPMIENIRATAHQIHKDVNQQYDGHPYGFHLDMVADMAIKYGYEVICHADDILPVVFGAYFHDSIEDARLSYNDVTKVAKQYMTDTQATMAAEIAFALTDEKGRTRAERANAKYYEGIRTTPYAPLVKLADRMANMTYSISRNDQMAQVYASEMPSFIKAIDGSHCDDIRLHLPHCMVEALLNTK